MKNVLYNCPQCDEWSVYGAQDLCWHYLFRHSNAGVFRVYGLAGNTRPIDKCPWCNDLVIDRSVSERHYDAMYERHLGSCAQHLAWVLSSGVVG